MLYTLCGAMGTAMIATGPILWTWTRTRLPAPDRAPSRSLRVRADVIVAPGHEIGWRSEGSVRLDISQDSR